MDAAGFWGDWGPGWRNPGLFTLFARKSPEFRAASQPAGLFAGACPICSASKQQTRRHRLGLAAKVELLSSQCRHPCRAGRTQCRTQHANTTPHTRRLACSSISCNLPAAAWTSGAPGPSGPDWRRVARLGPSCVSVCPWLCRRSIHGAGSSQARRRLTLRGATTGPLAPHLRPCS